jgi:hypothetical protein
MSHEMHTVSAADRMKDALAASSLQKESASRDSFTLSLTAHRISNCRQAGTLQPNAQDEKSTIDFLCGCVLHRIKITLAMQACCSHRCMHIENQL